VLKIKYSLQNTYKEVKVESHEPWLDVSLNGNDLRTLLEVSGTTHDVLDYPTLLLNLRATSHQSLCDRDVIEGTIRKGKTEWALTEIGKTILEALIPSLDARVAELKRELDGLARSGLEYRIENRYYQKVPDSEERFCLDLMAEHRLNDGPKTRKIYELARRGCDDHFGVATRFEEMVELIGMPDDPDMFVKEEPVTVKTGRRGGNRLTASVAAMRG
jgi:hypothetical protein